MKINLKKILIYIIVTFLIGNFFIFFVSTNNMYNGLNKPFVLPSIVFPIVWSILYLLMGISAYLVSESNDISKNNALKTYLVQLIVNSLWTLIFFGFRLYVIGFVWIILLIILVIIMIVQFYRIKKIAGLLNIPYLLWLVFAAFLSFSIALLN